MAQGDNVHNVHNPYTMDRAYCVRVSYWFIIGYIICTQCTQYFI
jgi:hypothetical protein